MANSIEFAKNYTGILDEGYQRSAVSSGISGMQCFYNCRNLVGGDNTVWSNSKTGYTYMRIDKAGQAGYPTVA